ncbi:folate family ECF transporter S component [Facklamia miroungae]|uniref:ECF transporter S component, folate family n=1 Tax=Facklamia miroungae TaxID=120956 RepID=A0A1G7R0P1_9LACT|nr:folate family ECF transporter S component [Facklamia miroungae]NKZ29110.1 folate family ECF transporter S component [Facklamia miroungae]SDG03510.1 ECF transporter S component, folate family [Facklamia miroungae]
MEKTDSRRVSSYGQKGRLTTLQLTTMALLLAFRIMLAYIPAFRIGEIAQIGVGFIGTAISSAIIGPWWAIVLSMANDIITALLNGYSFFFGYTLSAGLAGFIYGWFLWRKELNWKNILISVLLVTLIVNLGLGSLWIRMMQGKAWAAFMPIRIAKNAVSFPLNTIILVIILQLPVIKRLIRKFQF